MEGEVGAALLEPSRKAVRARAVASSRLRAAAARRLATRSAVILLPCPERLEAVDDSDQVQLDLLVLLDQPLVTGGARLVDQFDRVGSWSRWAGRCSTVVRKSGQVRHALGCGQCDCNGRPQ